MKDTKDIKGTEDIKIRRAAECDILRIGELLYQVNKVHSDARPDLFKSGGRKYTDSELKEIIDDDSRPIFVAEANGIVQGYAFCVHTQVLGDTSRTDIKTLYIDDLCVDSAARGKHIGTKLYEYVLEFAKMNGYYNVTLNVWADNPSAVKFYEHLGLRVQKIGMEKIL